MNNAPARHSDKERNKIINQTSTDLEKIINGHDPENDTSLNNMVWDRLDKMAVEIEARLTAKIARLTVAFEVISNQRDKLADERDVLRAALEEAARLAEQGIMSMDGGQAAVEIRSLIPRPNNSTSPDKTVGYP